jgi:nitrate/nitrite transporter NarK
MAMVATTAQMGAKSAPGAHGALGLSTVAFTTCFAVWTIFSILGVQIKQDLGLSETQFGLLIGTPILTGSLIRLLLGVWTDQLGGRVVFPLVMLAAAVATFLLSFAETYPQFLMAALGVGIAGGSFAVGATYVSKFYPSERQGTALGIFGAGNVGAAVTKFAAPIVLAAMGWEGVARVWAAALVVMAVIFFLFTKDDPDLADRRARGVKARSLMEQMEPLKNVQVWRFSLYYFFVFGAFVALALWLPRYLVGVYGFDLKTAGMVAAAYSIPGSLFRVYGGHLSDKVGARKVMYWTFLVSMLATFILSYPATTYVVDGIRGPIEFRFAIGPAGFIAIAFVLGFFMSLGKAAVYKHIPIYYPKDMGSVGGLVGMIGGLGGFILPILFGILNDLTGVWTSCFMLLFAVVTGALLWMHFAIRHMEQEAAGDVLDASFRNCRKCSRCIRRSRKRAHWRPKLIDRLAPRGGRRSGPKPAKSVASPQSLALHSFGADTVVCRVDGVVGRRRQAAAHRLCLHHRPACSGLRRCPASPAQRSASSTASWCPSSAGGSGPRSPPGRLMIPALGIGSGGAKPEHALLDHAGPGSALRPRRRELRLLDVQHRLLLSQEGEGQRARASMPALAISVSVSCSSLSRSSSRWACLAPSAARLR